MIFRQFALSLVALMAIGADALGQDTAAKSAGADNQLVFNNVCRTCHTLKEGDNRLGPNLHNIIGRKAGSVPDYGYSSAMKDADLTWDKATLDRFIPRPVIIVPLQTGKTESISRPLLLCGVNQRIGGPAICRQVAHER